jgi:hypothetical protein
MAVKKMNYVQVCQYPLCGITFMSNRNTAKYCCPQHNSLAYQWRLAQKGNAPFSTKEQPLLPAEISIENEYSNELVQGIEEIKPPLFQKEDLEYDCSEDGRIIYLDEPSFELPEEAILVEKLLYNDLQYGIGIHTLRDRYGNLLYFGGPSYNFDRRSIIILINVQLNRIEEWILIGAGYITCIYKYKDLSILKSSSYLENARQEVIEKERRHLQWTDAAQKYYPELIYGVERADALKRAGILKLNVNSRDDIHYNVLTEQELKSFFSNSPT